MNNGVKFKYTHFTDQNQQKANMSTCTEDLEVPCSHPSPACFRQLTSRERRSQTARIRREFKERVKTASTTDGRIQSSHSTLHIKFPNIKVSRYSSSESLVLPHTERLGSALSVSAIDTKMASHINDSSEDAKKRPMKLEDFIKRHPSGMGIRPDFKFNIELQPIKTPVQVVQPTHRKTHFQNYRKGRPRFHFIDPDWFSERETFMKKKDDDRLKYHWI